MKALTLFRLAGACAIAGGALRFFSSFFLGGLDAQSLQVWWLVTDVFLMFGLVGVYLFVRERTGWLGLIGFAVSVVAILLIRTAAAKLFGEQSYMISASVLSVGLAILSVALLLGRAGFGAAAGFWLGSLAVGFAGTLVAGQSLSFTLAAILFSAGYVAAGLMLIVRSGRTLPGAPS